MCHPGPILRNPVGAFALAVRQETGDSAASECFPAAAASGSAVTARPNREWGGMRGEVPADAAPRQKRRPCAALASSVVST
jgi:hypothetical protein